jgi:hypothetical protein
MTDDDVDPSTPDPFEGEDDPDPHIEPSVEAPVAARPPHPIHKATGQTTWSGRKVKLTQRAQESYAQQGK